MSRVNVLEDVREQRKRRVAKALRSDRNIDSGACSIWRHRDSWLFTPLCQVA